MRPALPIHNLIPEWNRLFTRQWKEGSTGAPDQQLPEVHRRVCPPPWRGLVRARHQRAWSQKFKARGAIVDKGFEEGGSSPSDRLAHRQRRVAVVGCRPGELAEAARSTRPATQVFVSSVTTDRSGANCYGIPKT